MDIQQIRDELRKIMVVVDQKFADRNDIGDDTSLREGLGLDSLQVTELLFEIEERFGARISDEEAMKLKTVGDLIATIKDRATDNG